MAKSKLLVLSSAEYLLGDRLLEMIVGLSVQDSVSTSRKFNIGGCKVFYLFLLGS